MHAVVLFKFSERSETIQKSGTWSQQQDLAAHQNYRADSQSYISRIENNIQKDKGRLFYNWQRPLRPPQHESWKPMLIQVMIIFRANFIK